LVVATLLTGYYIIPSVGLVDSLPSLFPGMLPRAEKVNLGLDLQGGMHLVLEVQAEKAVENTTERLREKSSDAGQGQDRSRATCPRGRRDPSRSRRRIGTRRSTLGDW
jgi:preprotein translocase subunit SecD